MFYTPGQLRDTVGLSKEAFRHWKGIVPALSNGRGHAPCFTVGDVLASAVLRRLTESGGVRIGHLTDIAPAIFEACNAAPLEKLQNQILAIDLASHSCVTVSELTSISRNDLTVVCPLAPVVKALQQQLLNPPIRRTPDRRASTPRRNERRAAQ